MGDICNPCCDPCHDPCCNHGSNGLLGGGTWIWIIVAIIIIWAISDNNGCC